MNVLRATLPLAIMLLMQTDLFAGMYVCRDTRGQISYTNVRTMSNCLPLLKQNGGAGGWLSGRGGYDTTRYDKYIARIGKRYSVDPRLIKAIIHTESDFDYRAVSKHGAQGLMQLMPATARELRVFNPFNPQENIDGGTRYFRSLLDSFGGDLKLSLAAYNAGPTPVRKANGIPPIPETVRYVQKVLRQYRIYKAAW